MKYLTTEDAFALALIAQGSELSLDLVEHLSESAKPIGMAFIYPEIEIKHEHVKKSVDELKIWVYKTSLKKEVRTKRK